MSAAPLEIERVWVLRGAPALPTGASIWKIEQGYLPEHSTDDPDFAEGRLRRIERDLVPATTGRIQFHGRVAANMLGIVERELEMGPAQREAHRQRLASLGVDSDAALAEAIRSGALDARLGDVVSAVRAAVEDKLRVADRQAIAVDS